MNQKLQNIVGLASGYALGQGSFLIASLYLLLKHRAEDATAVGVAVTTLTLLQQIFDYGGTSYLARRMRNCINEADPTAQIAQIYLRFSMLRLTIATVITLIVAAFFCTSGETARTNQLVIIGTIGLLLWSFNTVGILDGRNASGVAGLLVAPPWLFISTTVLIQAHNGALDYSVIGLGFSAGVIVSLGFQLFCFRSELQSIRIKRASFGREDIIRDAKDSTAILMASIPGQLTGRIYIYAAAAFLRPELSAAFIFARTLLNASNNILLFTRRAEFANLIDGIRKCANIVSLLKLQKASFLATIVLISSSLTAALIINLPIVSPQFGSLRLAFNLVGLFSLTLGITYLTGAQIQGLLALGNNRHLLRGTYLLLAVAVAATPFIKPFGIAAIWMATFISNLATVPVFARGFKRISR